MTARGPRGLGPAAAGLVSLAGLIVLWEGAVWAFGVPPRVLPAPSAVLVELVSLRGVVAAAAAYTLTSALIGYLVAALVGLALGIVFAQSPALERGLFPFFVASQAVPVIAFSAIVILWLGNGALSKIAIAFYLSFFPITVNVVKGLHSCDPMAVALLRTFGAGRFKVLWTLRLPAALPFLFVALRVTTTTALIGAIVGEWFGDNRGIGTMILQALYTEDTLRLWCGIAACAVIGLAFYGAVAACERRLLWWPVPALDQ